MLLLAKNSDDQGTNTLPLSNRLIKAFCLSIAISLLALGIGLLWASFLPFELVKNKIDALCYDGIADPFTRLLFEQIVVKLRLAATALSLAGLGVCIARRQAERYVYDLLSSFFSFSRYVVQHFASTIRNENKLHLYALFAILLIAVVARFFFLFRPMGYDEAWTFVAYASKPLVVGLSYYSGPNNHLFHTLLVHMAYLLLGNQPWVIRLPAFFAGILLIPVSYMVTRMFYNKHAALLAAGLVASSSALVLYSTDARGYTILCLLFLLIFALAAYLKNIANSAAWLLFAILSALGFFTIPIMLYPFGIVVTWLFLSIIFYNTTLCRGRALRDLCVSVIIVGLLTFVLYIPAFMVSGFESVVGNRFVAPTSWSYFSTEFPPSVRSVWNNWNTHIPSVVKFLLVIGFFTCLGFHKRLSNHRVPIMLAVVVWLVPILLFQRVVPFVRVWLFLLPLFFILASSGISYFLRPIEPIIVNYKSAVFVVLALGISSFMALNILSTRCIYWNMKWSPPEAEPITIFLQSYLKPGDAVLCHSHLNVPLTYYFNVYGIPPEYLTPDVASSKRILVIVYEPRGRTPQQILGKDGFMTTVNEPRGQTLQQVLGKTGFMTTKLGAPMAIKRYGSFTLYEIPWAKVENRTNSET